MSSATCPIAPPVAESRTGAGRRRAKERSPGHGLAALLVPCWVTSRCAPRCRAGALRLGCALGRPPLELGPLPLGDGALVGGLGLRGELALGPLDGGVGLPDACAAPALGGAGGELEPAELATPERRLSVGVVLATGEQGPKKAGELSGGGNDRHRCAAPALGPLVEGAQRARRFDHAPRGLDQCIAAGGRALL